MPQVASDPKIHVPHHNLPRVARPAQPDRAPSPFESLLEDTSQPAEAATPPPESKAAAKSDDKQAPAKSKDCNPVEASSDAKPEKTDEVTAVDETPADGSATKADGKKAAKPATAAGIGVSIEPEADHEPAAGQQKNDATAALPADGATTVTSSGAISIVPTPMQTPDKTPDAGEQVEQPLQQLAIMVDAKPTIKQPGDDLPNAVAGKKAKDGKQLDPGDRAETDLPAGDAEDAFQILTKDALHAQGKPQTASDDGDKHHVSQARGDFITTNHRSDAAVAAQPGADITAAAKTSNDVPTQPPIPGTAAHASENALAPAALVSQPGPQPAAVPLAGVAIEIAGKALAGKNRFEIRLDPPELGRIDVRLDVDRDGNVTSRLTVDRQETLDLLRRDAAGLERALQDAGLKTANNGLQFSLRDQSLNDQQAGRAPDTALMVANDEVVPSIDVMPPRYGRLPGQGGGLDIRV